MLFTILFWFFGCSTFCESTVLHPEYTLSIEYVWSSSPFNYTWVFNPHLHKNVNSLHDIIYMLLTIMSHKMGPVSDTRVFYPKKCTHDPCMVWSLNLAWKGMHSSGETLLIPQQVPHWLMQVTGMRSCIIIKARHWCKHSGFRKSSLDGLSAAFQCKMLLLCGKDKKSAFWILWAWFTLINVFSVRTSNITDCSKVAWQGMGLLGGQVFLVYVSCLYLFQLFMIFVWVHAMHSEGVHYGGRQCMGFH